ncbi:MAG: histidine phosphatase family protein [Firmicutes bacterium]|nr:histidine phosphatase family protein [Bacillota bacterium]
MSIWAVRHGATEFNESRRFQGRTDEPLGEIGRGQARELAAQLAGKGLETVYCSDLRRALETARSITEAARCPLRVLPELGEMDFGSWEGMTFAEIEAGWPELAGKWVNDPLSVSPPEGESLAALVDRVGLGWEIIRKEHPSGGTICVVAHSGSLAALRLIIEGRPSSEFARLAPLAPGSALVLSSLIS